jgi:hypothetical protein
VDGVEEATGVRRLAFLRILPLDLAGRGVGPEASPAGRWRQEWEDLWSLPRPEAGVVQPAASIQSAASALPVLPPVYFCPKKSVLIPAVCPECPGPAAAAGAPQGEMCPRCGSPAAAGQAGPAGDAAPLETLWKRVREGAGDDGRAGGGAAPAGDVFCTTCDRRETCYPAAGPSTAPDTAGAILVPLASRPWGGVVVEPFHLPIAAWLRLIGGTPWAAVRRDLKNLPGAVLEEIETRFREERRFLYGPEAGAVFGLESFLLKLETLRQILTTLGRLAVDRGHPHLGMTPETVWVRLEPADSLRSALWSLRVQLLDPAPGFRGGASGDGAERYGPPAGRPALLTHPDCGEGGGWLDGLCIIKGASTSHPGALRVQFLPAVHFKRPPLKGDLVRLMVRGGAAGEGPSYLLGRVETALPEMCQILIAEAGRGPEEAKALLTKGLGGSNIKMSVVRDHSLVDDLYAAGTLWIASLLANPSDFAAAAKFRDDLSPRLRGTRPGGGDTAVRESLKAAEASRLFAIHGSRDPIESAASRSGMAVIDAELMARSLALGMRLCGAVPAGYPCQDHEPAGVEERARAYDTLLSMVVELGRQAREGMLGAAAGRPEDEILTALSAYARERSARGRTRTSSGAAVPTRRFPGDA